MAEGGNLPAESVDIATVSHDIRPESPDISSGDAEETFCDPCKNDDDWIVVEGYCHICEEYLCENCLRMHQKLKMTKGHVISDRKRMPKQQTSLKDICVDVCATHRPEIIRYFCKSHDEPGCGDCMTLSHGTCEKDRVQDISEGFQNTDEFQNIVKQLQQLHHALKEMDGILDKDAKNLDTPYNNVLLNITSFRKQVNDYLDEIEKKILDEAAQMRKEDETELKTLQAESQAMGDEMAVLLKALNDSNNNVNSLFVLAKQAKRRLVTMEKQISKINQRQEQQPYEFQISDVIDAIVTARTPLGKLSRTSPKHQYIGNVSVLAEDDKENCLITDCALLSPDRMAVTDAHNMNVKLIDLSTNNKTVVSNLSTSSPPMGITALGSKMIAVTLPQKEKILLHTVKKGFTFHSEIKVNDACYGIAYNDDEKLAVSYLNPGRIDILDVQNKRRIKKLHLIQPKQGKEDTLQCPNYIAFGQNKDTVIVSDSGTNSVSIYTFDGQVLNTYTHNMCEHPQGIVNRADGVLFICSYETGHIHVVSPDLRTKYIMLRKEYVENPQCITYCKESHRLYISNTSSYEFDGNNIHVFELNTPVENATNYVNTLRGQASGGL